MVLKVQNTLSGKKDDFVPIKKGIISMYNCGPTVYDRAHVGNLRAYVFADIIRRTFEYAGYKVEQVINITDVGHLSGDSNEGEDKMTKALRREGRALNLEAMKEVGKKYFDLFVDDLRAMNVEPPAHFPFASDHIGENIEIIGILKEKGYAYKTADGMYFDTAKFPGYGKLGNINIRGQEAGARVHVNKEKKNPSDFALWKFNDIGWDSPFGKGFPGWHIECSSMSRKYLGQPFDIHTGGIDHVPVHHNNEIAQSEAAYGVPLANYWLHNEFVNVLDKKMAKSEGNFITLETLLENSISPLAYRYWLMTAHYRSPVVFSYEAIGAAQKALMRLMEVLGGISEEGSVSREYEERFRSFIFDDFDTPKAIALLWEVEKDKSLSAADRKATILCFDRVLGLKLGDLKFVTEDEAVPDEITALAEAREDARRARDWEKADALRKEIESRGYEIKDESKGYSIRLPG